MRYLSSVYIQEHRARISLKSGSLIVSSPEGKQRIGLETIDAVVLLGGAQITTDAIAGCVEKSIRVMALKRSGALRFVVGGPRGGNVHLRMAQLQAANTERVSLELAKSFVTAKLQNSRRVLARWSRDTDADTRLLIERRLVTVAERLGRVAGAPTHDHLRGIEGDAARAHFAAMRIVLAGQHLAFAERTRRPPRDAVNALLSFCYAIATTELIGAADAVGLDHQVGFLHVARSGRPALALDLLEETRPLIDRFVVGLVRRRQLGPQDFETTPGGAVFLTNEGRRSLLLAWEEYKNTPVEHQLLDRVVDRWALPTVQCTLLARHLRGDLPGYPAFVVAH